MNDSRALTVDEAGDGRPAVIIHGGGGPMTIAGIAGHLAETMHTITPTLPGWNGTERPDQIQSIPDLAALVLQDLEERDLSDVLVVGSSIGGWIAAEMATRDTRDGSPGWFSSTQWASKFPARRSRISSLSTHAESRSTRSTTQKSSTSIPRLGPPKSWP
jgi:surfactin synthase thioesterase subunit